VLLVVGLLTAGPIEEGNKPMSATTRKETRPQHDHEPAGQLSAEEREVLERIKKQGERKLRGALWRFGKNPPLFYWWWMW
jgi:hypothetical protein